MMATWAIETLDYVNDSDQIVSRVHWRCYASQEVSGELYTADLYGSILLDEITADASRFVAYTSLTESTCLGWVWEKLNKADIETRLQKSIDDQTTPALKSGKPWE